MMRSTHLSLLLMGFLLLPNFFLAQNIQDILQRNFPDFNPELIQLVPDDLNNNPPEFKLRAHYKKTWDMEIATWMPDDSTEYYYYENGYQDQTVNLIWDGMNWENDRRTVYTFVPLQIIAFEHQSWVDGEWGHTGYDFRYSSEYDENGNTKVTLFQSWGEAAEEWLDNSSNTYTYDPTTNLLQERIYERSPIGTGTLEYTDRYLFQDYDEDGKDLLSTNERWNTTDQVWEDHSRTTNIYDDNGNLIEKVIEAWNADDWVNAERSTNTWINGHLSSYVWQNWSASTNDWVNIIQALYELDEDGNRIKATYQEWINDDWVNDFMVTSDYDENGNLLLSVREHWIDSTWQNTEAKNTDF